MLCVCVYVCVCVCVCVWGGGFVMFVREGSRMHPRTYPGQLCLRRLPEEDLCRAGTHSVPHRRVTHWTETPAVRCQWNSPAGTGCPSELWGYMWDRDSEDTGNRDTNVRHGGGVGGGRRGTRMSRGGAGRKWKGAQWGKDCCPFEGFLLNWVKRRGKKSESENDSHKLIYKVALQSTEHSQRQEKCEECSWGLLTSWELLKTDCCWSWTDASSSYIREKGEAFKHT